MNRKIMYLLAGFLFACFTAMASTDNTIKLKVGENERLYQIVSYSTGNVVRMNSQNELGVISSFLPPATNTLWYVQIVKTRQDRPNSTLRTKPPALC